MGGDSGIAVPVAPGRRQSRSRTQDQEPGRSRRPPGPLRAHEIMNVRDFVLSKILKRLDVGR